MEREPRAFAHAAKGGAPVQAQEPLVAALAEAFDGPGTTGAVDLADDPAWHDIFYGEPTEARIKELGAYLRSDPNRFIRLYHGTDARHPIMENGLLPTSGRRAKSLQSGHGYVYLSVYRGMAEDFGRMAYPGREIKVYAVEVTARRLLADLDQLRNKRQWSDRYTTVGNSLAESLAVGHGARVKGKVDPYQISPLAPAKS